MSRSYADMIEHAVRRHGMRFSDIALTQKFVPYYESQARIKVRTTYTDGSTYERTGTVSVTAGWRPCFMLMHRSNAMGSSDLLSERDEIIAVKRGQRYVALQPDGS